MDEVWVVNLYDPYELAGCTVAVFTNEADAVALAAANSFYRVEHCIVNRYPAYD